MMRGPLRGALAGVRTPAPSRSPRSRPSSSLNATLVRNASIDAGGTVRTVATLVRAVDIDRDADEKRRRELAYDFGSRASSSDSPPSTAQIGRGAPEPRTAEARRHRPPVLTVRREFHHVGHFT